MKAQEQIERLKTLQESLHEITNKVVSLGDGSVMLADVAEGKKQIADAINYKGGVAEPTQAFTELAEEIKDIENFPTTGFEFISEIYRPRTLMEAYNSRLYLKSIVDNITEELSGTSIFLGCTSLTSLKLPGLTTISGNDVFRNCASLTSLEVPELTIISGNNTFLGCTSLTSLKLPELTTISGNDVFVNTGLKNVILTNLTTITGNYMFYNSNKLENLIFGNLIICNEPFITIKPFLRNITIGQGTDIYLPFQNWTATNVIEKGQSGIDELNSNLYNNLLTKLYDHSEDGQTRTLRLGWLAHVSQENIDYANAKGWTLTT